MIETIETLNTLLGAAGVALLAVTILLFFDIFTMKRTLFRESVEQYGLLMAAGLLVGSMGMALVYSEIFGFVPCGLCWSMRIFVFSQAFIVTAAVIRKDSTIAFYGIVLSIPGIILGLYQHYLQMGGTSLINCPASGGDCSKRILFEFGFMTFPLLGVAMLLTVTALYIYLLKKSD